MTTLYPVNGAKIYIGGSMDLPDADMAAADFSAVTWVEIKDWTQMGNLGDAAQVITTAVISRGRDIKQKGTRNAGQMQNVFAIVDSDAGQTALLAAVGDNENYPFKIVFDDAQGEGGGHSGSQRLFLALVSTAQDAGGNANTVQSLNATLEVNSNVVRVAST